MQKITPFLWYDTQAEEAVDLYTSLFKNSKKGQVRRWGQGTPYPAGSVMLVTFELDGREYTAFNGGPMFKFTEAFSLVVICETQEEVDEYWNKLTANGGKESQCGWLKDKFGLSWQIVPRILMQYMGENSEGSKRAVQAMMQMGKLEIADLKKAYEGK
jgi:predicted 3-demethylubiquinone-9 3-methyltransferase (glyoxalase superfamily)